MDHHQDGLDIPEYSESIFNFAKQNVIMRISADLLQFICIFLFIFIHEIFIIKQIERSKKNTMQFNNGQPAISTKEKCLSFS